MTSVTLTASSSVITVCLHYGVPITTATNAVSAAGTYSVTDIDPANGCSASASVAVTQNIINPDVSIAPPAELTCAITSVTLTASSSVVNVSYDWGGGITTATNAVSAAGNYSVTVTDPVNGCSASASVAVSQNIINPDVIIAPPAQLTCAVTSVTLTASSSVIGVSYDWGGGITTATNAVSAAGNYSVTVTDPLNGCSASASVAVSQNIINPDVIIAPPAQLTCAITSVTLTASSSVVNVSYDWGGGITTATNAVSAAGNYSVTVTDPVNGCSASASVAVSQNIINPDVIIAPPAQLTCAITSVTLTASSSVVNVSYDWGGGITTATNAVSAAGNYSVTVTDPVNGCSASASVAVSQNIINPDVIIAPPAQLTCAVTSVTLTASSSVIGVSYDWGGGITTATNAVSAAGNYSVTVTDPLNGCSASASVAVSQNIINPDVIIAPPAQLTCAVTSVTLTASSSVVNVSYDWGGGITTATNAVSAAGNYSVTVTDPVNGCSASASVSVSQNIINPDVSIAPPAQLTCAVTSVTLTASSSVIGVNYDWGGGITTATNAVSAAGNYSVTVTDPVNGCSASASVAVTQNSNNPDVSIAPPAELTCTVTSVTLTASSTVIGVSYDWGGGITTATNAVSAAGTYSVTVTDPANGCSASASVAVAQNIVVPNVSIAPPADLTCTVTSVTLTASSTTPGVSYDWGGGVTTATDRKSVAWTYSVKVTDRVNDCSASASVAVAQ